MWTRRELFALVLASPLARVPTSAPIRPQLTINKISSRYIANLERTMRYEERILNDLMSMFPAAPGVSKMFREGGIESMEWYERHAK